MSENLVLPSQEALVRYPMFYRQSVQRRLTQLKYLQDRASLTQLPKDSVLHLLDDNFMVNKPLVMVPDDRNWLLSLQPSFKFLQHVVEPLPQRWCELPEQLFLPARGVYPTIRRHRLTHLRTMRPWTFDRVPNRMNSQLVVSYLPLYRARILGLQRQTRRFNYIFANLLNGIAQLPDRTHFIPIPVSNRAYLRPDFMLSFKSYNKISIKYPQDMWYQFMMHLLGFLYHDHTDSLLENVPEDMWEKIHFIFYAGDKMVIHTLKNLKTWNGDHDTAMLRIISQCNQLALLGSAVSIIEHDELVETVPEPEPPTDPVIVVDQTHQPVETAPTEATIPAVAAPEPEEEQPDQQVTTPEVNHPVTDAEKEEAQQLEQRLPAKLKPLIPSGLIQVGQRGIVAGAAKTATKTTSKTPAKTKEPPTPEPTPEPEDTEEPDSQSLDKFYEAINQQIDSLDGKWDSDTPEELLSTPEMEVKRVYNAPKFRMHDDLKQRREKLLKSEMQELDAAAAEYIDSREELSPAQKNKLKELSTNYKQIRVNGRTVKDILNEAPDDAVNKSKLDCLKGQVTEDSMLECSTDKFDQDYMDKLFLRDLVSELASFNAHGMFLQNVEITDKSDWMSDLQEVSVAYIDENREKHNFKFTLPKVNRQGYLKVNGTVKVLKKQRFPVPIAKVSPTRVALTSDYNKYLVERNQMAAHSFINYIDRILEKAGDLAKVRLHFHTYDVCLPYEYVALGRKYSQLDLRQHDDKNEHWRLKFVDNPLDYEQHWLLADNDCPFSAAEKHQVLQDVQEAHGVLVGYQLEHKLYLYMQLDGTCIVRQLGQNLEIVSEGSFIDVLTEIVGVSVNGLTEWVDLKLLSKAVPAIFALCYRYGLSHMLNYTGVGYYLLNKDTRSRRKASDIVLKFKDATLVIPRNPLKFGLLFGGLGYYDLKRYNLADMDEKGPYYDLLEQKRMSTYNIRGIDNYFDFFVDPITKEILTEMHEPTTAKDLLIRSCELLTTEDHPPVAASNNFRYRSYERINAAVYKTLSKQFAMVKRDTTGRLKFTIPSFEVQQLIMTDQMLENVDIINPINDIKYKQEYGHGGFGGRESIETFMVVDRQFTDDSVGICSEGSPESGKVAYAASLSMNPSFYNLRGMTELKRIEGKKISPTEMVSCTSVLMPGVCQDDGKRANFVNVHLSHYVATNQGDVSRVRTGFEKVVAHRTNPPFAYCADEDGTVEKIDENKGIMTVRYKSGKVVAMDCGELYTSNSSNGFYCTNKLTVNNLKVGSKFKQGAVLVYNREFFEADPMSDQVNWKIGRYANVAVIPCGITIEDSSAMSRQLADDLTFNPCHIRDVVLKKNTTVHEHVKPGSQVVNTDPIIVFDESDMSDSSFGSVDAETAKMLAKLNRRTPTAHYTGEVVRIDVFYACEKSSMSKSIRAMVEEVESVARAKRALAGKAENATDYPTDLQIKTEGTRIGLTEIDQETVMFRFYIKQTLAVDGGDKVEFDSSLKSVVNEVIDGGWDVEDKSVHIDALFSAIGISNRIINSPIIVGIGTRIAEQLEREILDIWK